MTSHFIILLAKKTVIFASSNDYMSAAGAWTFDGDTFAAIWLDQTMNADASVSFTVEDGKATGIKMKAGRSTRS